MTATLPEHVLAAREADQEVTKLRAAASYGPRDVYVDPRGDVGELLNTTLTRVGACPHCQRRCPGFLRVYERAVAWPCGCTRELPPLQRARGRWATKERKKR